MNSKTIAVLACACLVFIASAQAANSTKAYKLGWLMSFPLQDLTWSYAHDFARQRLELELDRGQIITTERCCIPEDSPDEAYAVGKEMITTYAHDLVLAQSPQLTAGLVKLANEFPKKFFVLYPPDPSQIPKWPANLGAGFAAFFQATYLAGRLAAQMTKTKKVGYIVGYSINIVYASVNAHFIGIRRINKDVQLYVIETGNWYDQRLHTQATNQLIDLGCDVISMYGTGMYYVTAARDRSTKANPVWSVGLHTDAQAHIIGATAVVSLLFDWLPQYRTFTLKLLNNTWDQTLQYQFGTVQNGVVKLSAYHPDVPQSARDDVDKEYDKLKQSDGDFFCDPLVAELKPANTQYPGCLSNDQVNYMAKYLTGVNKVNGVFFWNELFWDYSDGAGIAAAILNSISVCATIFYTIIVIRYMNTPIIKAASPLFCFIILGCGFIGHAIVYIVIAKPTDITCQLYLWLAGIAIATLLSSLLLKLFRVWRLFSSARKLSVSVIPIPHLLAAMAVAVAIELILLTIWTAVDALEATLKDEGDVAFDERLLMCDSDNLTLWRVLFFVYGGILLASNAILAFLVRDVKSSFAESKMIALMTYNMLLISVILLPIVWIFSDKWQAVFIIRVYGILYVVSSTMALLFIPKVIIALGMVDAALDPENTIASRTKTTNNSS